MGNWLVSQDDSKFLQYIHANWKIFTQNDSQQNETNVKYLIECINQEKSICFRGGEFGYSLPNDQSKGAIYKCNVSYYIGKIKNHKADGKGVILYHDFFVYKGEFKAGECNGEGKLFNQKMEIIQDGNWLNGKFVKGMLIKPNINISEIQIKEDQKFTVNYANGAKYFGKGVIKDQKFYRNGKGKFVDDKLQYHYEGNWKMNKRQGQAKVADKDTLFEGQYKDDARYKGQLKIGNFIYDGEWEKGQIFTGNILHQITKVTRQIVKNQIKNI